MKQIFTLAFSVFFAALVYGQCQPMTDFGEQPFGVSPDTIVNFAPAQINMLYTQQIDVKVPSNGAFIDAALALATIDSASIALIEGLPTGLSYTCQNLLVTDCTFPGGATGCGVIAGIPLEAGTFELNIVIIIYGTIPFLGATTFPLPVQGYRIEVADPLNAQQIARPSFQLLPNMPNPCNVFTDIQLESPGYDQALISVYDLVGKQVLERNIRLVPGKNSMRLETHSLRTGMYVYRIDAFGERLSGRFAVSR